MDFNTQITIPDYKKIRLVTRTKIIERLKVDPQWQFAYNAMEVAEQLHTGFRKDGQDEISHQYMIVAYLFQIEKLLSDPVRCVCLGFLHDTIEDYGPMATIMISNSSLQCMVDDVRKLSKLKYKDDNDGLLFDLSVTYNHNFSDDEFTKKDPEEYFNEISGSESCSIVKLVDRLHNFTTMGGVFTNEKVCEYITEYEKYFVPMMKTAKRLFPKQDMAYENLKYVLNTISNIYKISLSEA